MTADHFTKFCKVMFLDSKISLEYASGRTKTTALVKHALAPALNSKVIHECQTSSLLYYVMEGMTSGTRSTLHCG